MSLFNKFKLGLQKSSKYLKSNILHIKNINDESIEDMETALISSDLGVETTMQLIKKIKKINFGPINNSDQLLIPIAQELTSILKAREKPLFDKNITYPQAILFVGVNGSGKTTSIGKLIFQLKNKGKILVVACDTFRAAAVDQLKKWSDLNNANFFQGSPNQDPASVAFQACKKAINENFDFVLIDTAGRLSNNTNFVNQLIKIKSVIQKTINPKQIKSILVLDGTNGSNMLTQVEIFGKAIDINGLIITKLDGTAKGGALISIAKKFEIPINFIGFGENENDLHKFDAQSFSYSLLDLNITK